MRNYRLVFLLACGIGACRNPAAPEATVPIGEWVSAPVINRFDGSIASSSLSVRPDLTYVSSWHTQDASHALRAYVTAAGTFTVRGDSMFLRSTVVRSWDRDFYGGKVTVTPVSDVGPWGYRGARYEVRGDSLVLHYLSYPADAAVETTESYVRAYVIDILAR